MSVAKHHKYCDWQLDQYDFECTCGATRPKAEWFDVYVAECDALVQAAMDEARREGMTKIEIESERAKGEGSEER